MKLFFGIGILLFDKATNSFYFGKHFLLNKFQFSSNYDFLYPKNKFSEIRAWKLNVGKGALVLMNKWCMLAREKRVREWSMISDELFLS